MGGSSIYNDNQEQVDDVLTIKLCLQHRLKVSRVHSEVADSTQELGFECVSDFKPAKVLCLFSQEVSAHQCIVLVLEKVEPERPLAGQSLLGRLAAMLLGKEPVGLEVVAVSLI
jgi:hypothetical protein